MDAPVALAKGGVELVVDLCNRIGHYGAASIDHLARTFTAPASEVRESNAECKQHADHPQPTRMGLIFSMGTDDVGPLMNSSTISVGGSLMELNDCRMGVTADVRLGR